MKRMTALLLLLALALTGCRNPANDPTDPTVTPPDPDAKLEWPTENPNNGIVRNPNEGIMAVKPVIYLYPEAEMTVEVKLEPDGEFVSTYPAYRDGWKVTARPDGTLTDPETGREYYCLFWESRSDAEYDLSTGFVVPGGETAVFLEGALAKLGLTEKEANEFIIYWLPRMEDNAWNLISFQQEAYTQRAVLRVDPAPDTVLRVFMTWQALDEFVEVVPQTLESVQREGFTVVEWGGAEIPKEGC